MGGDEGALALPSHQQVLGRQLVDRLAHRALAHLVAGGDVHFAGDRLAGLPLAGLQAARDQRLDLLVQRAERRPGRVRGGVVGRRRRQGGGHAAIASQKRPPSQGPLKDVLYKTEDIDATRVAS